MGLAGTLLRYFFLTLFATLLIGSLMGLLYTYAAQATFLEPSFYKKELESAGAYDVVYAYFNAGLSSGKGGAVGQLAQASGLSLQDVVQRPWIKSQAENLIDNAFAYLNSRTPSLNLTIYLAEPKARLIQLVREKQGEKIAQGLEARVDVEVPDTLDLAEKADTSSLVSAREAVASLRTGFLVVAVFSLVLLVLTWLLTRPSLPSFMRWAGAPLVVAGGFSLLSVEALKVQAFAFFAQYPDRQEVELARRVVTDAFSAFGQNLGLPAALILILGAALFAGSFFIKTEPPSGKPPEKRHEREGTEHEWKKKRPDKDSAQKEADETDS